MKKGLHPESYRPVVFKDMSNGDMFLSRSTVATKETIEFEGETYPLLKIEISNTSHPFYTGKSTLVDTYQRRNPKGSIFGLYHPNSHNGLTAAAMPQSRPESPASWDRVV